MTAAFPDPVLRAIDGGALVVVNDSGGKDSAAAGLVMASVTPPEQVLHVHATLGESEWPGTDHQAQLHAQHTGGTFISVQAARTLLEMVERRHATRPSSPPWASPKYRYCTSDGKRQPLDRAIKAYAKAHGYTRVISVMGLRAQESRARAQKPVCVLCPRNTIADRTLVSGAVKPGREWLNFLPIHAMSTDEVFGRIEDAGLRRHYAYDLGNERVSCILCHMGSKADLINGATHNPGVYQKYARMEIRTGFTFHPSQKSLPQITGIPLDGTALN